MSDSTQTFWTFKAFDGLSIKIPADVPRFTPADLMRSNHGMSFGDPCHNCSRPWQSSDWPIRRCPGCHALPQTICTTGGCMSICMPEKVERENGSVSWYSAPIYCRECMSQDARRARGSSLKAIFPPRLLSFASSYTKIAERESLDRALHVWATQQDLGRKYDETVLLTYGPHSSGKSVALVRAGAAIFMRSIARSVCYIEADEIFKCTGEKYSDHQDARERARDRLRMARDMELTIIDGMRSRAGITQAQKAELSQIILDRIRKQRPTILAQDMDTPSLKWLDGQLSDIVEAMKWRIQCQCNARELCT